MTTGVDAVAAPAAHPNGRTIVGLCFAVALFEGVDLQAAGLVAPGVARLFHLAPSQLGSFFSAGSLGLVLGALVGGRLADRVGRKRSLILAVALFGLGSLATASAGSFGVLSALRLLTGIGLGGALPNLIALSSEAVDVDRRNRAVGLMYCGMPFGGAAASLLVGVGFGGGDWRMLFLLGGAAPVILLPLLIIFLRDSLVTTPQAVRSDTARDWASLLDRERRGSTLALWTSFFFGLLVLYLLLNWLPSLLVSRGLARVQASWVQGLFNLCGGAAAVGVGTLMDGRLRRSTVIGVFVALAVGLWFLAAVPVSFAAALVCGGFVGAAMLGCQAVLYGLAPSLYPTRIRGTGVGAAVGVGRLGSVAGPLLAGGLMSAGGKAQIVLLALLPLVAISGAMACWLAWRGGFAPDTPDQAI